MTTGMPYSKTTGTAGRDAVEQRERVHEPHDLAQPVNLDLAVEVAEAADDGVAAQILHALKGDDLEAAGGGSLTMRSAFAPNVAPAAMVAWRWESWK